MSIKLLIGSETNKEWLELPCDNGKIVRFLLDHHDYEWMTKDNNIHTHILHSPKSFPILWDWVGFPISYLRNPITLIYKSPIFKGQKIATGQYAETYGEHYLTQQTIFDLNLLAKLIEDKPKESLAVTEMIHCEKFDLNLTPVELMNWIVQIEEDDFNYWENEICPNNDYEFCQQILKSVDESVESACSCDPRSDTLSSFRRDLETYYCSTEKGFFRYDVFNFPCEFRRRDFERYFEAKYLFVTGDLEITDCPYDFDSPYDGEHCRQCLDCNQCHMKWFLHNL